MFSALGLVLLTGPFVSLPSPVFGGDPALIALARDPAQMRLHCFSTRCNDAEWRLALAPPGPSAQGAAKAHSPPPLPGGGAKIHLRAPARQRDAKTHYANHWRIGTQYRFQALRDGPTQLGLLFGAGYRLAPLHDDGIGRAGPVFRGELNLGQQLGERAYWRQRIQLEAGDDGNAFVKQSLGLDVALWPSWTLEADYVIRHDTTDDTSGPDMAESWLGLRRRF